jgi:hypothetical protein
VSGTYTKGRWGYYSPVPLHSQLCLPQDSSHGDRGVNQNNRERLEIEYARLGPNPKKPKDLVDRKPSAEDFIDSAIIGGLNIQQIVAGHQIPRDVVSAFHAQYPNIHISFTEEVRRLYHSPEQLQGFINGVKGKLFEIDYTKWLNDGHLPAGYHADLASHANNPAWDVIVRDAHGSTDNLIQVKASEGVQYVHQAIQLHPSIDVAVPHDVYEQLIRHPELASHILDSGETLGYLNHHLVDATSLAADALHFHFPYVALVFAMGQNYYYYRTGKRPLAIALNDIIERGVMACITAIAAWLAIVLTTNTLAGIPVAILVRVWLARKRALRAVIKRVDGSISVVIDSRCALEARPITPLLRPITTRD